MTKKEKQYYEILQKAKIVLIYPSDCPDYKLVAYYNLCKDIFGRALQEDKPEIIFDNFEDCLEHLPERDSTVIKLRYGINNSKQPYTYTAIANIMGFSRTTASNICKHTIRKLRHHKNSILYNIRIQERKIQRLKEQNHNQ